MSLLHDIGAYKTEEIDNMVVFETKDVMKHAAYGYVFLKNTTPLKQKAQAILYHHTDDEELNLVTSDYKEYARLIHLADKADILLTNHDEIPFKMLYSQAPARFSIKMIDDLKKAQSLFNTSKSIRTKAYKSDIEKKLETIDISADDAMLYLKMLVYSIEFRSVFTLTHTIDVSVIASEIAKRMNIDKEETDKLYLACFLHDIGKIAIPYTLIEKQGSLTYEEMELMKKHVTYTREILSPLADKHVCLIASNHHEKINGKGYPNGLKGDEMTACEKIAAVADIASALINKRSYKGEYDKTKTLSIINAMKDNGELSVEICDMLNDDFDDIMKVVKAHDNEASLLYNKMSSEFSLLMSET